MQEQAASDALSGWVAKRAEIRLWLSFGNFATASTRRRSDLRSLYDSQVSCYIVVDHVAGHCQARSVRRRGVDHG